METVGRNDLSAHTRLLVGRERSNKIYFEIIGEEKEKKEISRQG